MPSPRVNLEFEEYDEHHIVPVSWQPKPPLAPAVIQLTPDQHRDVHTFIDLLVEFEGKVPWFNARRHGKFVRNLAEAGYSQALELGLTPRRTL